MWVGIAPDPVLARLATWGAAQPLKAADELPVIHPDLAVKDEGAPGQNLGDEP